MLRVKMMKAMKRCGRDLHLEESYRHLVREPETVAIGAKDGAANSGGPSAADLPRREGVERRRPVARTDADRGPASRSASSRRVAPAAEPRDLVQRSPVGWPFSHLELSVLDDEDVSPASPSRRDEATGGISTSAHEDGEHAQVDVDSDASSGSGAQEQQPVGEHACVGGTG